MKNLPRRSCFIVVLLLLVGCATTGLKYDEFTSSTPNLNPDHGRIYIYRTSILGAAVQPEIKLNGEAIGRAVPNGFIYIDREPGNYEIMTATEVKRKLSITLDKGQTRYVHLNVSIGFFVGHIYPELVDTQVGEKEIKDCRYIGEEE